MNPKRAVGLLGLVCLLAGGCASTQEFTRDLPGVKFMKYTMAGANRELRESLDRGLSQLRAREYDSAARSLRQAMWDVELIDEPSLRLEELVEVHQTLAETYIGLGKKQWSEEQRALAQALVEYGRRENESGSPQGRLSGGPLPRGGDRVRAGPGRARGTVPDPGAAEGAGGYTVSPGARLLRPGSIGARG